MKHNGRVWGMEGQGIATVAHWNVGTIKRPWEFKINTSPVFFPSFLTQSLTLIFNWWVRNLVKGIWERKYLGAVHPLTKNASGRSGGLGGWCWSCRGRWGGHGWVQFHLLSPGSLTVTRETDSTHITQCSFCEFILTCSLWRQEACSYDRVYPGGLT